MASRMDQAIANSRRQQGVCPSGVSAWCADDRCSPSMRGPVCWHGTAFAQCRAGSRLRLGHQRHEAPRPDARVVVPLADRAAAAALNACHSIRDQNAQRRDCAVGTGRRAGSGLKAVIDYDHPVSRYDDRHRDQQSTNDDRLVQRCRLSQRTRGQPVPRFLGTARRRRSR